MDRHRLSEQLRKLPIEELIAVLHDVFVPTSTPKKVRKACDRSRYFLGRALSTRGEDDQWGPWELELVAYPDSLVFGKDAGPDWGLCQEGTCVKCGHAVRSNVKNAICPLCDEAVGLT